MYELCDISDLVGKTFSEITTFNINSGVKDDAIYFDNEYVLMHNQDCCEMVYIEEIIGDLKDLEGTPILFAEAKYNEDVDTEYDIEKTFTWSFYEIRTIKGSVTIRFYGTSNGYYSEKAFLYKIDGDE